MKMNSVISVAVPFLNEEGNLPELYNRLVKVFASREEDAEFIFIDDGSSDNSVPLLAAFGKTDPRVKIIQFSRNFGHQAAITAGMDFATGDALIIMDADLQDPPEVLPEMIEKWKEGYEVVYAVRKKREGEGFLKKLFASCFYRIFRKISNLDVPVDAGDFRLMDRNVVDALKKMREKHRYIRGMTTWVGFRQCAVEYDRAARLSGETKYPVWKSAKLAIDAITSFSARPLLWVTNIGLFTAFIAVLFTIRIIWIKLSGNGELVSGWASLSVLILFLGGIQLTALGLLGQYISRIFDESKSRPLYVIRERK